MSNKRQRKKARTKELATRPQPDAEHVPFQPDADSRTPVERAHERRVGFCIASQLLGGLNGEG